MMRFRNNTNVLEVTRICLSHYTQTFARNQAPQYILIAIAEILGSIASYELFYSQVRSIGGTSCVGSVYMIRGWSWSASCLISAQLTLKLTVCSNISNLDHDVDDTSLSPHQRIGLLGSCWHAVGISSAKYDHVRYRIYGAWIVRWSVRQHCVVRVALCMRAASGSIYLESMPRDIQIVAQGLTSVPKNIFQVNQRMYFVYLLWLHTAGNRGAEFDARVLYSRQSERRKLRVSTSTSWILFGACCRECADPHRTPLHSSPQCLCSWTFFAGHLYTTWIHSILLQNSNLKPPGQPAFLIDT